MSDIRDSDFVEGGKNAPECPDLTQQIESLRTQLADAQARLAFERKATDEALLKFQALEAMYRDAESQLAQVREDAAYYKWRLQEIVPLFEEARDALPALSLTAVKLHGLRLDLASRMDVAGTRTRADYEAALAASASGDGFNPLDHE